MVVDFPKADTDPELQPAPFRNRSTYNLHLVMDSKAATSACVYCKPRRKPRGATEIDEPLPSCCLNDASSVESDLCCTEDSWEKESPDPAAPLPPVRPISGSSSLRAALPSRITASERAPLRRPRPGGSYGAARLSYCEPFEERVDSVMKLVHAQDKFCPARHPGVGRPMFFSVSPFVAERRKSFVAWKSQMASYFGYSRDTVAVALNYFDRYTSLKECNPTLAQAVAVTSLHIAAKFEEPRPAPLRDLLKFTPVFTPKQLLAMELSVLKVLNWELRPVTVYDCVRGFCSLLLETSRAGGPSPSTLSSKEEKKKEVDQLRVLAEEIADLSLDDVGFVDFLPSTMATSALLLSVSHNPRPVPLAPTKPPASSGVVITHEDVLDTCCKTVAGVPSLQRVIECVRLLSLSFSQSFPAVATAAQVASARVTRYANRPTAVGGGIDAVLPQATAGAGSAGAARSSVSTTPELTAVPSKGRRCCTPTGIEGIVHIEIAAIGDARSGIGEEQGGSGRLSSRGQPKPANLVGASGVSVVAGEDGTTAKHPRPTPCSTRVARARVGSLSLRDESSAFDGTSKRNKRAVEVSVSAPSRPGLTVKSAVMKESGQASIEVSRVGNRRISERKHQQKRIRRIVGRGPLQPLAESSSLCPISGGVGKEDSGSSSTFLRCRKRSAEALGHCESGSGFGAPAPRANKVEAICNDAGAAAAAAASATGHAR